LHDGVLQTLAVVERRSDDPILARLAREQERELRAWLFGTRQSGVVADLGAALAAAAGRFEDAFGGRVQVLVADDLPSLRPDAVAALTGAAGEALVNAGKHGHATKVQVYVEPDEAGGVFCSVKDDGCGFDPAITAPGIGLARSIRGRMAEAGGRVEVVSTPGNGAEVVLWLPA
jgi:signal transduction histidine kinase